MTLCTAIITMGSDAGTPALSRLLQLASPLLPVGAYAYSQGLEWAIEDGTVHDASSARRWIGDALTLYLGRFELPLLWRLWQGWSEQDDAQLQQWNLLYLAGRDCSEAHAESLQMGYSLARLARELEEFDSLFLARLERLAPVSFAAAFAGVAVAWGIAAAPAAQTYAWAWVENQVSAAMKAVPLGQVAGQRMLSALGAELPALVSEASLLPDEEISNFAPGLSLAGCRHETQYSRLFRS